MSTPTNEEMVIKTLKSVIPLLAYAQRNFELNKMDSVAGLFAHAEAQCNVTLSIYEPKEAKGKSIQNHLRDDPEPKQRHWLDLQGKYIDWINCSHKPLPLRKDDEISGSK